MKKLAMVLIVLLSAGCGSDAGETGAPVAPAPAPMADEEAALRAIRAIAGAQSEFIGRERRYARSVEELVDALYLPAEADWSDSGYDVWISLSAAADNYRATVTAPDGTGLRSFFVDGTGVIRWARGEEATADDTVLEDPAAAPATDPDAGAPVVSPQ